MKKIILFSFLYLIFLIANAQINNSIYTPEAKQKLKKIVDSLNLKFKNTSFDKKYFSLPQAKAHFIYASKNINIIKQIKIDIEKNISFEEFEKKYPNAINAKNGLVTTENEYFSNTIKSNVYTERYPKDTNLRNSQWKNKWIIGSISLESDYPYISALYIVEEPKKQEIPQKYTEMINYTNFMIDPNISIFTGSYLKAQYDADDSLNIINDKRSAELKEFSKIADTISEQYEKENPLNEGVIEKLVNDKKFMSFEELKKMKKSNNFNGFSEWYSNKFVYIRTQLKNHKKLVLAVYEEAIKTNSNLIQFYTDYLEEVLTADQMLKLRRISHIRYPNCGNDNRAVFELMKVEYLAAKVMQWNILLHIHLEVIGNAIYYDYNRKIQRTEKRFMKSFEDINIDMTKLLLGTIFKTENLSNRYGNIRVIGTIFSAYKDKRQFEETIYQILSDTHLDIHNRLLIYKVFIEYLKKLHRENKMNYVQRLKTIFENTKEDIWKNIDYKELKKIIDAKKEYEPLYHNYGF